MKSAQDWRPARILLLIYAFLGAYTVFRSILGLPFQLWLAFLLPFVGVTFSLVHAVSGFGWRRAVIFLGLTLGLSLLLESVGVITGWVYGPYHYTARLGPLFLGSVPYLIPLTWFMMLYPSYVIAARLASRRWGPWVRLVAIAACGGLAMTAWDLVLDPLMVARSHWVWEVEGEYFGIPLHNYFGWWLTSFVILLVFGWIEMKWLPPGWERSPEFDRLAVLGYAIIGLGSILDAIKAELVGPALAALVGMAPWAWSAWNRK